MSDLRFAYFIGCVLMFSTVVLFCVASLSRIVFGENELTRCFVFLFACNFTVVIVLVILEVLRSWISFLF